MKEIKKTQRNGRIDHAHKLEELISFKNHTTSNNPQIQFNLYQIIIGVFHRIRANNPKIPKNNQRILNITAAKLID